MTDDREVRRQVAALARDLYAGAITFEQFMSKVQDAAECPDKDVRNLIDLVEHEPTVGGLLGVNKAEHQQYMESVFALIDELSGK
jgi:hypothetical protein